MVRMIACDILVDAGWRCLEASDAHQALDLLQAQDDVWLMITDIRMPGPMNGLELAEVVGRRWPHIKVLIISGAAQDEQQAAPTGASFVAKPYRPDQLVWAVEGLAG